MTPKRAKVLPRHYAQLKAMTTPPVLPPMRDREHAAVAPIDIQFTDAERRFLIGQLNLNPMPENAGWQRCMLKLTRHPVFVAPWYTLIKPANGIHRVAYRGGMMLAQEDAQQNIYFDVELWVYRVLTRHEDNGRNFKEALRFLRTCPRLCLSHAPEFAVRPIEASGAVKGRVVHVGYRSTGTRDDQHYASAPQGGDETGGGEEERQRRLLDEGGPHAHRPSA